MRERYGHHDGFRSILRNNSELLEVAFKTEQILRRLVEEDRVNRERLEKERPEIIKRRRLERKLLESRQRVPNQTRKRVEKVLS